nr:hypothetical protein [Streptomyces sp. SID4948]
MGSIVQRLDDTKATFSGFEEDMGDGSVVDALDHFENNWKDGRGDIHKQLSGLEKMANTVVREIRKVDADLAQQLAQSMQPAAQPGQPGQPAQPDRPGGRTQAPAAGADRGAQ